MCLTPQSAEFDASMQELIDSGLAIARGETNPRVFLVHARALWEVRDLQGTAAALDRAISGQPSLSSTELSLAYSSRSICHLQMGNIDAAEADATASLELNPRSHPFGLRGLIRCYQNRYDLALRDAEESLRIRPDDPELRAWRGRALAALGRHAEAIQDFDAAISSGYCERYASELHLQRARAHLALGHADAAECDCTTSIDLDYHEQSHWPFVVTERVRHAQDAYLLRAEARLALGEYARALGDCFWAASIAPGDPAVYDLRARVYHAAGNFQEVVNDTVRANYLRSTDVDAAPSPAAGSIRQTVAVA